MEFCRLTIHTTADDTSSTITRMGKISRLSDRIILSYREENAQVTLLLEKGRAEIERVGDYSLRLLLLPGTVSQGALGVGGSEGVVQTRTRSVEYRQTGKTLHILLEYALLFGEERQEMRLEMTVECKSEEMKS